eukprot:TRINITY_DN17010_c0_g2_i1.p1 TRINITY_DN17010_c0_g2~~TRINITY_DN17010_c0_g2_i1.p1  ORF type:complete len:1044 (-),score=103.36 TRINITY_DN17010_c0_g2_i1:3482-6613(-)
MALACALLTTRTIQGGAFQWDVKHRSSVIRYVRRTLLRMGSALRFAACSILLLSGHLAQASDPSGSDLHGLGGAPPGFGPSSQTQDLSTSTPLSANTSNTSTVATAGGGAASLAPGPQVEVEAHHADADVYTQVGLSTADLDGSTVARTPSVTRGTVRADLSNTVTFRDGLARRPASPPTGAADAERAVDRRASPGSGDPRGFSLLRNVASIMGTVQQLLSAQQLSSTMSERETRALYALRAITSALELVRNAQPSPLVRELRELFSLHDLESVSLEVLAGEQDGEHGLVMYRMRLEGLLLALPVLADGHGGTLPSFRPSTPSALQPSPDREVRQPSPPVITRTPALQDVAKARRRADEAMARLRAQKPPTFFYFSRGAFSHPSCPQPARRLNRERWVDTWRTLALKQGMLPDPSPSRPGSSSDSAYFQRCDELLVAALLDTLTVDSRSRLAQVLVREPERFLSPALRASDRPTDRLIREDPETLDRAFTDPAATPHPLIHATQLFEALLMLPEGPVERLQEGTSFLQALEALSRRHPQDMSNADLQRYLSSIIDVHDRMTDLTTEDRVSSFRLALLLHNLNSTLVEELLQDLEQRVSLSMLHTGSGSAGPVSYGNVLDASVDHGGVFSELSRHDLVRFITHRAHAGSSAAGAASGGGRWRGGNGKGKGKGKAVPVPAADEPSAAANTNATQHEDGLTAKDLCRNCNRAGLRVRYTQGHNLVCPHKQGSKKPKPPADDHPKRGDRRDQPPPGAGSGSGGGAGAPRPTSPRPGGSGNGAGSSQQAQQQGQRNQQTKNNQQQGSGSGRPAVSDAAVGSLRVRAAAASAYAGGGGILPRVNMVCAATCTLKEAKSRALPSVKGKERSRRLDGSGQPLVCTFAELTQRSVNLLTTPVHACTIPESAMNNRVDEPFTIPAGEARVLTAVIDSGSETTVLSAAFCRAHGLSYSVSKDARLQMADGQVVQAYTLDEPLLLTRLFNPADSGFLWLAGVSSYTSGTSVQSDRVHSHGRRDDHAQSQSRQVCRRPCFRVQAHWREDGAGYSGV